VSQTRVNHVGHVVADLDRARRFYIEAFGFRQVMEFPAPDENVARLLQLPEKPGLTAVYLERGGFILELLHYANLDLDPQPRRTFREAGLTHLSLSVDELDSNLAKVREFGGEVLDDTRVDDIVILARDPDGQLLELVVGWETPG
jgi:catechol 2,3-dioxygenase-like lactoylglutathione lyase family enzyme